MTAQASAEWLARGRNHQREGRPVDAMLCLRRALREAPQSVDARFHLGEVLWQLGRLPDAIAIWREAARLAPHHPAAHQALAEALLGTGEFAAARDVAKRLLELSAGDTRAQAIVSIGALWLADDVAAVHALCDTIARDPELLRVPAIAGSLALCLDRQPPRQAGETILDAVLAIAPDANRVASMPALLLARMLEHLEDSPESSRATRTAWIEATLARPWALHDHDALRRVALAAVSLALRQSVGLAQHYADLCARVERAGAPPWPRRTRGARLRVIVLPGVDDPAARALAALATLPAERFAVTTLHAVSDDAQTRRLTALDADVVVDLAGLTAPVGVALAQRPARARMTIAVVRAPNHPPLLDHVLSNVDELVAALERMQMSIDDRDPDMPDAAAMDALWRNAVDAHRRADHSTAQAGYRRVLEWQPAFAPAHYLLGVALRENGEIERARNEFAAALAAAPDHVPARVDAIRAAVDAHDVNHANALAAEGSALHDDSPPALLRAFGAASLAAQDGAQAAAWFEAALLREPIDGETHYNHGVALQMKRRFADAARAYQRALAFNPNLVAADFNLGTIFTEQGNRDAAIAAFTAVIARESRHVAAYKNLGELLFAAGRIDAWLANFRTFEANCPEALPLAVHALEVCQYCGEFDQVDRYLHLLRNERLKSQDAHELVDSLEELLYLLLFFDVEPDLIHRLARTYDAAARKVYGDPLPRAAIRRPGKVRIGYLSADLRNHVMGKMLWQAVRHHDRERFEIAFYSLSAGRDEWTRQFEGAADRFDIVAGLTDRQAAARIAADDLDILIDVSTHTKGARPGILALKPARVQITHVASAGTLGLSAVDFKLTDRYADVDENQAYQLETLLPMDGSVYPYRHIEVVERERFRRETFGIAPDAIVIAAFVTGLKLSRRCLSLWRQVLERLPKARLAFSPINSAYAPLYERLVAAAGIDVGRILFLPQAPTDAENQARYALIDFVLDPMPYGGVNGTLEALDMEVPVVTLVGKRHAERTSFSILSNLGVAHTIAHSGSEYVAMAVRLANDRPFMEDVRTAIRTGLERSPLTNMPAHARNLEAAYVEALRRKAPDALVSATGAMAST